MNVIDLSGQMLSAYENGCFSLEKWECYMDRCLPGAKALCLSDMREVLEAGYSWEKDFLPVLNAVAQDAYKREEAIASFRRVSETLDERIRARFGKTVDTDLVVYLGLCNGAGWAASVDGKPVVLLGIEKIMELNWCDVTAMSGLVIHELGHVYQEQYGVLRREFGSLPEKFLWQLFTEGVAMVFEQEVLGDPAFYQQDVGGWKQWCDENAALIRQSFCADLDSMTQENQRYFGDWVRFLDHGDTGYYLGARFVRFLLEADGFDNIIGYGIEDVKAGFDRFLQTRL